MKDTLAYSNETRVEFFTNGKDSKKTTGVIQNLMEDYLPDTRYYEILCDEQFTNSNIVYRAHVELTPIP